MSQEIKDFISGRGPPPAPAEVRPDILAFLNRIGAAGGFSNNYHASSEGSAEVVTAAAAVDGNSQEDAFLQSRHTSDKTGSDTSYDGGPLQHLHALVADTGLGEPKEIEDKERKRKGKETAPSVSSDPGSSNASYPSFEGFASDAGSSDREVPLVQYLAVNSGE